jgi:hypothetical protein
MVTGNNAHWKGVVDGEAARWRGAVALGGRRRSAQAPTASGKKNEGEMDGN